MKRGWIYTRDGRVIEKGTPEHAAYLAACDIHVFPAIYGDEGDFLSPIDGKVYSGRAGMREHNARHDVVNNRDLVGLPTGINPEGKPPVYSTRERRELREAIIEVARSKGAFDG